MIMAAKKTYFNIASVMDTDMVEYDTRTIFLFFLIETLTELCIKITSGENLSWFWTQYLIESVYLKVNALALGKKLISFWETRLCQ